MAVEVGTGYVSILPDLSRLPSLIRTGVLSAGQDAGRVLEGEIVGAAERAGRSIGEEVDRGSKSGIGSIGELAAKLGGIALVAAGIGQAMSQSLQAHKLEASLGLSATDAQKTAQVAAKVYGQAWGDSLDEVGATVGAVTQSLGKMGSADLETITTKALAFKGAFGTETPDTIRAVSQMIRTGLVKDAGEAFDVIAVGMQNGSNKADDLIDTFNEYGTQFRKLGIDGPAAMGLITQAIQGGARDSDIAADALKEFSIRAVDGSKTSAAAFKALGLDAGKMTAQIAQGGPQASAGLQTVLDRLRGMKDPAAQAAAATGLFGTQAEDLGQALFAMNPATAASAKGMQDLAGAGDRVTSSMSAATDPLESFKRQGMDALASAASSVLPPLTSFLGTIQPIVPELVAAGIAAATFVGVTKGFTALQEAVKTVQALELATKAKTVADIAASAWTKTVAAAQWLWNAAMSANPIGIVVIAVAALVAGIILAYQHSETFRKIVQGAWEGIKTAASVVWNSVLKPIFDAFVIAGKAVGTAAMWLWQNAIAPAWNGIKAAISVAWTIIKGIFSLFEWYGKNVLAPVAMFFWNVIKAVWSGISTAINVAWIIIKAIFNLIRIGIELTLGPIFRAFGALISVVWTGIRTAISVAWNWVRDTILVPAGNFIKGAFTFYWTALKTAIDVVWNGIKTVVSVAWNWVRDNVLKPLGTFLTVTVAGYWNTLKAKIDTAWDAVKTVVKTGWDWVKTNVFDPIKTMVTQTIPNAFSSGTAAIGRAWDKVQELAKKPVTFVVRSVINPLIRGYNTIVDKFGGDHINEIQGFSTGGIYPGYTPGRDIGLAAVSGGEAIMRPEFTRAVGPDAIHSWNAAAKSGGVGGVARAMGIPGYADGGIIDWITHPIDTAKKVLGGPLDRLGELANTSFGRMISGMPRRLFDSLVEKAKSLFDSWIGGGGGGALGGGSGPGGWQWMTSVIQQAFGGRAHVTSTTGGGHSEHSLHYQGRAIDIVGPFMEIYQWIRSHFGSSTKELIYSPAKVGIKNGKLVDILSFYGSSVYNDHFDHVHWGYDVGGWLPPGSGSYVNRTGQPEAVLTAEQWRDQRAIASAVRGGDGAALGTTINVYPQRAEFKLEDLEALQDRQNALARVGRPR